MPPADGDFTYRTTANGEVAIRRGGRVVTILRGQRAGKFLASVASASPAELQAAMARVTGNYRRGNERTAAEHLRNK